MMKRAILCAAFALVVAGTTLAQPIPHGQWWRRAETAQNLGLTEDQKTRLDTIFRSSANDLIDLKAEVDKASIAVHGELDQPQINRDALRRYAARLSDAQGKLFERELMMLVDMRAVLSTEQWSKLRAELERPRGGGPRGQMRPQQR